MNRRDFIAFCAAAPLAPSITKPTAPLVLNLIDGPIHIKRHLTAVENGMGLTQEMLDQAEDACDIRGDPPPAVIIHGDYIMIHGKLFRHEAP